MLRAVMLALTALLTTAPALAAPNAAEASLRAFFARGIHHDGATAELVAFGRLPDVRGAIHWRLPRLNGHPSRVSLIA
ncbi:MAG: flagella basal body P-ring formation protein FlgA, partial [Mariprofundaceae bacterium]